MDFFRDQEIARRNTRLLTALFVLAVLLLIAAINIFLAFVLIQVVTAIAQLSLELELPVEGAVVWPATDKTPDVGTVMSLTKVSNLSLELPAASVALTVIVGVDVVPDDQVTEFEVNGEVESTLLVKLNPVEVPASDGNVTVTPPDPASVTAEVSVKERLEPVPL